MSEVKNNNSALSDLAKFVAKSPLASNNDMQRRAAINSLAQNLSPKPIHKKVSNLLDAVLVLSARTRRINQPKVYVDIDVFSPNSKRAAQVLMG